MPPPSPAELAGRLEHLVITQLTALTGGSPDGWSPPPLYGGHRVGADVTADLAWTLAQLHRAGVTTVVDTPTTQLLGATLARVRGAETHTFSSYRIAEAVAIGGDLADNTLVSSADVEQVREIALACDSTEWIPLLDSGLPRNYAAVLARCEQARLQLGLQPDAGVLDDLLDRTRGLLGGETAQPLDDSDDGTGRYDIYAIDVVLFCEPLADQLGTLWASSARQAADLAALVAQRNGATVSWGRSTGALSLCLTVEVAALVHRHGVQSRPGPWLERAERAATALDAWFDAGVISAHRHRSPYGYRGPARRLQMTLDCLGKLAWSAAQLRHAPAGEEDLPPRAGSEDTDPFPDRDVLHRFETDRPAAVWAYRDRSCAFVLPFVGGLRSDYLAAPSNPGRYEVPVDRPLATWLPVVLSADGARAPATAAGLPDRLEHRPGGVTAEWRTMTDLPTDAGTPATVRDDRLVRRVEVDGRTIVLADELDPAPDAEWAVVSIPEAAGRPLVVEADGGEPDRRQVVVTDGIKEWHSFWGPLPRVHELAFALTGPRRWRLRVTPAVRVASEDAGHHYHRSLYGPLAGRVVDQHFPAHLLGRPDGGADALRHVDIFHLHWPEWFVGDDVDRMARFCDLLDRLGIPLLWTQHNLRPHLDLPGFDALYALVAARASAVIHHSNWGMARARATWPYGASVEHRVIPHGHFGNLLGGLDEAARRAARRRAEASLDLAPCAVRIGIVGAPRADKDVVGFAQAFARTQREDLGLLVLSARPEELEHLPADRRITALPYSFVDRDTYNERLTAIDVLALPFRPDGQMLTTGVVGDAVGLGVGVLCTSWPYLHEALGTAAIDIGDDGEAYEAALAELSVARIEAAAAAATALQERYSWPVVATQTLDLLEELLPPP